MHGSFLKWKEARMIKISENKPYNKFPFLVESENMFKNRVQTEHHYPWKLKKLWGSIFQSMARSLTRIPILLTYDSYYCMLLVSIRNVFSHQSLHLSALKDDIDKCIIPCAEELLESLKKSIVIQSNFSSFSFYWK